MLNHKTDDSIHVPKSNISSVFCVKNFLPESFLSFQTALPNNSIFQSRNKGAFNPKTRTGPFAKHCQTPQLSSKVTSFTPLMPKIKIKNPFRSSSCNCDFNNLSLTRDEELNKKQKNITFISSQFFQEIKKPVPKKSILKNPLPFQDQAKTAIITTTKFNSMETQENHELQTTSVLQPTINLKETKINKKTPPFIKFKQRLRPRQSRKSKIFVFNCDSTQLQSSEVEIKTKDIKPKQKDSASQSDEIKSPSYELGSNPFATCHSPTKLIKSLSKTKLTNSKVLFSQASNNNFNSAIKSSSFSALKNLKSNSELFDKFLSNFPSKNRFSVFNSDMKIIDKTLMEKKALHKLSFSHLNNWEKSDSFYRNQFDNQSNNNFICQKSFSLIF